MEESRLKGTILYHVVLVTKGRSKIFYSERVFSVECAIMRACNTVGCKVTELKVLSSHIHLVVQSNGAEAPLVIDRRIKNYIREAIEFNSYDMWRRGPFIQSVYPNKMQELIDYIKNNKDE